MKREIHLICNAHIDPIWQWDWAEGTSAVLSTFYSAATLAEKFDYIFCHNEVTVYKYVEEYAPDLFEKIKQLVKEGKWHIIGGWYLQPDCNMPSGESFVRQIREGQRYFMEKFGVCPTTGVNFDPFGHTVGLVQIMKKCGQDSYLFMRPLPRELKLPDSQFIWRGLDGSEIKACRINSYNSPLGKSAESIRNQTARQTSQIGTIAWGVGNHGGGPSAKDLSDIENEILSSEEIQYLHSTPESFFAKISPTAEFDRSLRTSQPGCYTSMHRIKQLHAQLENELYLAEKIASVAYAKGAMKEYPTQALRTAAEDLLNAEFHDVLPGTSIQCGEDAGIRFLNHGILEAERVKVKAYFALSTEQAPASEGEYPIVIFNPHPYALSENIECEFMLADQNWNGEIESVLTVLDQNGNAVPYQLIKEESNLDLDWRKRIIFRADMAPLSLTRYSVYMEYKEKKAKEKSSAFVFDNGRKYVKINPETGLLESYRVDGVEYLTEGFGLVSFDDNADPWAMGRHQLLRVGTNERAFATSANPTGVFQGMKSVQIIEDGDIYLGIEAFFEQDNTRARILYKIYKNNDDIDVDVNLYLGDVNRIYKLKVPVAVQGNLIAQTAFGTEEIFTDARENVSQRFVAIDTDEKCLAVLNQDVYGNHYENSAIYMSLVRGITYCAHPIMDRPLMPEGRFTKKVDQGENRFSFRLTVSDRSQLERKAQEFTMKPFALNIFPVPSDATGIGDFKVELGDGVTSLAAMKKADGKEAILLRLLNNSADERTSYVRINDAVLPLTFGKYEVKTVVYENGVLSESYELLI